MWEAQFSSAVFCPRLPEECQGNPGAYGFELAWWLAQALARRSIVTSYPAGEDWGWFIEHVCEDGALMVGCGSVCGEGEGYSGQSVTWRVFIEPRSSLKSLFKRTSPDAAVNKLAAAIVAVLEQESISIERQP